MNKQFERFTRGLTANEINGIAQEYFTSLGFDCWRQDNSGRRGRTFKGRRGVADVIGFFVGRSNVSAPIYSTCFGRVICSGCALMCEGKANGDKISPEQAELLINLNAAGGFGLIAEDNGKGGVKYSIYDREFDKTYPHKSKPKK